MKEHLIKANSLDLFCCLFVFVWLRVYLLPATHVSFESKYYLTSMFFFLDSRQDSKVLNLRYELVIV